MSREEIIAKLTEVFIDVFDDEDIVIDNSTDQETIDGWDSLKHITLVGVIEDEFGVRFDMKTISGMKNVGAIIEAIEEKL